MKKFIKRYKYYLVCLVGVAIMFIGALNSLTTLGMIMFITGMIISLCGTLLQLTYAPNFK